MTSCYVFFNRRLVYFKEEDHQFESMSLVVDANDADDADDTDVAEGANDADDADDQTVDVVFVVVSVFKDVVVAHVSRRH